MAVKGGTAAAVKQLEVLLREHRWAKVLEMLASRLSARQLRSGLSSVVAGRQREVLAALLAAGADANRDHPLYHSVRAGWQPGIEMLLAHGVDPGHGPSFGSPLLSAISSRRDAIGALLVRHGAPQLHPVTGQPLLLRAVHLGLPETVQAMLAAGAAADTRGMLRRAVELNGTLHDTVDTLYGDAPALVIAADCGHLPIVEALLAAGADADLHDDEGRTPLGAARKKGHTPVAELLAARGAIAEARRSPAEELFAAIDRRDLEAIGALLAAGTSPDTADPRGLARGRPPLTEAVVADWAELIDLLLASGADPDRRDTDDERPLTILGIARPADLTHAGERHGMTPLMYAALLDRAGCARRLLAAGARSDLLDRTRHSALMLAAGNGHAATVEALLAGGADPDLRGVERSTALHLAAGDNHTAAALALVAAGADPELRDADGNTGKSLALLLENYALLAAIAAAGAARPKGRQAHATEDRRAAAARQGPGTAAVAEASTLASHPTPPASDAAPGYTPLDALAGFDLDRYDTDAARARCREAAGPELLAVAAELGRRLGVEPFDPGEDEGRIELHLPTHREVDLAALQDAAGASGCFLFACEDSAGRPKRLALLPTADPLDAVAYVGVGEAGVENSNRSVIAWLAASREPWRLTTITHDTLAGHFLVPLVDPPATAVAIFRVCSDAVHQGAGDLESLAAELGASGRFYLWWD